jgi:multidrug efflux system outer membrane protein
MAARGLLLLCAAALAGCTLGPDYRRPEVQAPASFQYEPKDAARTADTLWWQQFQDPVLDQLITEALAHNTNIQIAAANVEQAAALLTQTRSQIFPQVGYGVGAQRERAREPAFASLIPNYPNPASAYQAALQASWEIDLWGRIRRQSEAAYANVLATDEARRGVILSLVAQVANSYLQLRGLDAQLEVAKRTLQTYKESVDLFTLQFQYGQVSMMNVAQAQSQYETAAAQIPLLESQIAQTQSSLAVLIGRDPGPIARGKSVDDLKLPQVPAGVPSLLLERRPDLNQAEQQLIAANAQIGAAKALYFPTCLLYTSPSPRDH